MGGGSSVMGMVAYRGTPDDYHEWEALGATGWGWNDVLPFYRKLEDDIDFDGELHGKDGPVPIRRTRPEHWAPLSKAVHVFAQERQIPFIADMNADFRDGYGAVPMSNWPDKRASAAICYLDATVRARRNLDDRQRRHRHRLRVRRAADHRRRRDARRRGQAARCARDHPLRRRHPFAGVPDALGHRAGRSSARARDRRAPRPAGRRPQSFQPRHRVRRAFSETGGAAGGLGAAAPDDGIPLFLGPAGRAALRHVHQRAVQDVVVAARSAGGQSGADAAQAEGARPRLR